MPSLLDFRRRIRSVKNTQQITRAMKFVAAARLRRAQESAIAARPYANELSRLLRSIMVRIEEPEHPLLAKRPEERILAIILSGERGLAGAFNANILRKANEFLRERRDKKLSLIPVGKKGRDSLKRAGFTFAAEYINVLAKVEFATAREIAGLASDLYAKGEIDAVYLIFSEFKTVVTANLKVEKLLPVEPETAAPEKRPPNKRFRRSITSTSSRRKSCSVHFFRNTWKRNCSARCSNLRQRNTPRAWPPWNPPRATPVKSSRR